MTGWQPIETAPKDGTLVLLTGGVMKDYRDDHDNENTTVVARFGRDAWDEDEWVVGWYDGRFGRVVYENATHWMPLPDPPEGD